MVGDPPLAPYRPQEMYPVGGWLCNAATGCDVLAVLQWQHHVTDIELGGLRALLELPDLMVGDDVTVFGCAAHRPA